MKIVLFSPPSETPFDKDASYPLGLGYLGAVLSEEGYEVRIYDYFRFSWDIVKNDLKQIILDESPQVVGLNCLSMNRVSAFKIAEMCKSINPATIVIMGGVHASIMWEQILNHYPIDIIVLGEGEQTIVALCKALENGNTLATIPGIAYKKNAKVCITAQRQHIKDINLIPFPRHNFFTGYLLRTKTAHMITSRGCPFGCVYCSTSQYWGRSYRERHAKNVVDEMEFLIKKYHVEHIMFMDDVFTLNNKRVIEICHEINRRNLNVTWSCETLASSIAHSEEMIQQMARAGCETVALGVESGAPRIVQSIGGKKLDSDKIINAFDLLSQHNITPGIFLIIGLPGESKETVRETFVLTKKLVKSHLKRRSTLSIQRHERKPFGDITLDDLKSVGKLQLFPGTGVYELAKKQGFIQDDYWLSDSKVPIYTKEHREEELNKFAWKIIFGAQSKRGLRTYLKFLFYHYLEHSPPSIVSLSKRLGIYYPLKKLKSLFRRVTYLTQCQFNLRGNIFHGR